MLFDCETGPLNDLWRFDGVTGAFIDTFASGGGLLHPWGLVFGPDENLYVSSLDTGEVLRFQGVVGSTLLDIPTMSSAAMVALAALLAAIGFAFIKRRTRSAQQAAKDA